MRKCRSHSTTVPRLWDINLFWQGKSYISLCQLVFHLRLRLFFESLLKVKKSVVTGVSSRSTSVTLTLSVNLMSGKVVAETWVQNRVSGHERRIERDEKVVQKETGAFIRKGDEAANLLPGVEEKLGKSVLFMSTMI